MIVKVHHHYGGADEVFDGTPEQVQAQLHQRFPWLGERTAADGLSTTLEQDVAAVDSSQAFSVKVVRDGEALVN